MKRCGKIAKRVSFGNLEASQANLASHPDVLRVSSCDWLNSSQCWLVSLNKSNLSTNGSSCSIQQTFVGVEAGDETLRTSAWEAKQTGHLIAFSSPEAAILLVSTENHDLWPGPTTEVRDSRTSRYSAHALSQVWQIWLVLVSIYCVYKAIQNRNVVGPGQRSQRSWFSVLIKRIAASGDENVARPGSAPIWGGKKGEFRTGLNLGTLSSRKFVTQRFGMNEWTIPIFSPLGNFFQLFLVRNLFFPVAISRTTCSNT